MASARIAKIREYEDRLQRISAANKDEQRATAVATWQNKSDDKVRQLVVQRRFEALKARREADLNARRQRLAEKLFAEDAAYKQELIMGKETPEQRRAKLAQRARELAAKREAERQQLAASLYERAFMENCDVLRETNSKRVLYRTLDERNAQIEQKMAQRIAEEEEKRMFEEMNETERLKKEQRHVDDKRKQQEVKQATIRSLDAQVRAVEERRAEEAAARQQEISELQALWRRMEEEQAQADAQDRERMQRLAAELQEFNRIKQMEISERARRELELDLKILQEALGREAEDEAREAMAREKRRNDVRRYREQLALMMQRDAEDEAQTDALIKAAADAQQARKDAEVAAREEARMRLWMEVDAIRQQQIADRRAELAARAQGILDDRAAMEAELALQQQEEAIRRQQKAKQALEQKLEVQTQMVAKAHIRAAEEDDKLRALEVAQEAERAYMTQVKDVLEKTDPPKWHGRKKFDWYN